MKRMSRFVGILLCFALILTGCSIEVIDNEETSKKHKEVTTKVINNETTFLEDEQTFNDTSDPNLHQYLNSAVYNEVLNNIDNDKYFVENVETKFISKEYIDELAYNSQENIFFGYTLSKLESEFDGGEYIFTLGKDGKTTVKKFEPYDDTYDKMIRNVAIGAGVILICVTVSVVTGGAGAPAAAMIFATAAKSGAIMAASSAVIGGMADGGIEYAITGDEKKLKKAALSASEGFKTGAIIGAITGGVGKTIALKGATVNGLKMNEVAQIQKETKYPLDVIKSFNSKEQVEICKNAGLKVKMINNKNALVRDVDLKYLDRKTGLTNLERMMKGKSPIEPKTGLPYELHHIGQKSDSTLAMLTKEEHVSKSTYGINHIFDGPSEIDRNSFRKVAKRFWKDLAKQIG